MTMTASPAVMAMRTGYMISAETQSFLEIADRG